MNKINHNLSKADKRKSRIRAKVRGTAERPRLTIYRSNKHTYLQAIDDQAGVTVASSNDKVIAQKTGTKMELAQTAAKAVSAVLQKTGITKVVIDRGPYKYHGRIKAIAEAVRAAGIEV